MCLDALHDRGLRRTNIGIARYAYRAHGGAACSVATRLLISAQLA